MELEEQLEDFQCQAEAKLEEKECEIQKLKDQLRTFQHMHVSRNGKTQHTVVIAFLGIYFNTFFISNILQFAVLI